MSTKSLHCGCRRWRGATLLCLARVSLIVFCFCGHGCRDAEKTRETTGQPEDTARELPDAARRADVGATLVFVDRTPLGIMDTDCRLRAIVPPNRQDVAGRALNEADAALRQTEKVLSAWRSSSNISQLNAAEANVSVRLDPQTVKILAMSKRLARQTGGAFDVTYAPLFNVWRKAGKTGKLPSNEALGEARQGCGWTQYRLDADSAMKFHNAAKIDLGGIAKGYGIDRAVEAMRAAGVRGGLVEVGGDIRCFGAKPGGGKWRIRIQSPFGKTDNTSLGMLAIEQGAICTSGNYERYIIIDGKRYSQIIDPYTGIPVDAVASVTVVAATAARADAWATALSVLAARPEGPLAALDMLKDTDIEAMIVVGTRKDHTIHKTPGFDTLLETGKSRRQTGRQSPEQEGRSASDASLRATAQLSGAPGRDAPRWTEDVDEARRRAKATHRPLLLNFAGSDWCKWCIKLKKEVFDTDEFKAYAAENLVPVVIDFPRRRTLPAETENRNRELHRKYGIRGFPTIVILDPSGKELGRTGYVRGGAANFIGKVRLITDTWRQKDRMAKGGAAVPRKAVMRNPFLGRRVPGSSIAGMEIKAPVIYCIEGGSSMHNTLAYAVAMTRVSVRALPADQTFTIVLGEEGGNDDASWYRFLLKDYMSGGEAGERAVAKPLDQVAGNGAPNVSRLLKAALARKPKTIVFFACKPVSAADELGKLAKAQGVRMMTVCLTDEADIVKYMATLAELTGGDSRAFSIGQLDRWATAANFD